jgi:hypothetical protein
MAEIDQLLAQVIGIARQIGKARPCAILIESKSRSGF